MYYIVLRSGNTLYNESAVRRQEREKKLGWQTWVENSVVPVNFAGCSSESQGFGSETGGNSGLSTQVCQPRKKGLPANKKCKNHV